MCVLVVQVSTVGVSCSLDVGSSMPPFPERSSVATRHIPSRVPALAASRVAAAARCGRGVCVCPATAAELWTGPPARPATPGTGPDPGPPLTPPTARRPVSAVEILPLVRVRTPPQGYDRALDRLAREGPEGTRWRALTDGRGKRLLSAGLNIYG